MPWTVADVDRHVKGLTPHQKTVWVAVANNVLARCQQHGGKGCDVTAIRQANATAQRQESEVPPELNLYEGILTAEFAEDPIDLVEAQVSRDGTIPIRIIQPGWGSSGYYGADVLQDAAQRKVYSKGLHMYWDHPSITESRDRPERSLKDLAAVLESDAVYDPHGPKGPGLYARAKVFEGYRNAVNELAPHIGVSHRASGDVSFGEAEGKTGPIVENILAASSVDFVTKAGAGGEILQLFEAAGRRAIEAANPERKENDAVELQEAQRQLQEAQTTLATRTTERDTAVQERDTARTQLTEAQTTVSRLREALVLREARDFVSEAIGQLQIQLPEITKRRLIETVSLNPVIDDKGELDKTAFATKVQEAVANEAKYLSEALGAGRIDGMGGGNAGGDNEGDTSKALSEAFSGFGLGDKALEIATRGRN